MIFLLLYIGKHVVPLWGMTRAYVHTFYVLLFIICGVSVVYAQQTPIPKGALGTPIQSTAPAVVAQPAAPQSSAPAAPAAAPATQKQDDAKAADKKPDEKRKKMTQK